MLCRPLPQSLIYSPFDLISRRMKSLLRVVPSGSTVRSLSCGWAISRSRSMTASGIETGSGRTPMAYPVMVKNRPLS